MKKIPFLYISLVLGCLAACDREENNFDATGTFEAVETIISAEVSGKILEFNLREGQELKAGETIGYIDSTQFHLQKLQLVQNKIAVLSGKPETRVQVEALKQQLATAETDRDRMANLVKGGVANQKQLDDARARISTLEAEINARESSLNTSTSTLDEQGNLIELQLAEVNDKLDKCRITNPVNGTVLSKYAEPYEVTTLGRPLYKIADLSNMILRAYITGDQFARIKLNQQVKIFTDDGAGGFREAAGTVTWISDQAEFTPKSILTKNERENLVYAIKVTVPNDGTYKIGMYGEIRWLN
jgi:HlyD family secretion protein